MLVLTRRDIERLVEMKDVIEALEEAFRELAEETAICPTRLFIEVKKHKGVSFFMPSYLGKMDALGIKMVNQFNENRQKGLPTILASVVLLDPRTGETQALMEGTYITAIRTGAASGLATKYLARKDSKIVGIIGTGVQSVTQIWAMKEVLKNMAEVKAYDLFPERAEKFAEEVLRKLELDIRVVGTNKECVENSDVIITSTTSKDPVLNGDWVKEGAHINSIGWGSDARELDDKTIKKAKIIVDTKEGALAELGDLIIPIKKGVFSQGLITELSDIVVGKKLGRTSKNDITCWKPTGLAIEDVATAKLVYEKAIKERVGTVIELG